jgi:uncharacterized protein (TIGR02271 family)
MERSQRSNLVISREGFQGFIDPETQPANHESRVSVQFESGERLLIPVNFLNRQEDGSYILPLSMDEARGLWPPQWPANENLVIPVVEEHPVVEKRTVETGHVRIVKKVAAHDEEIDEPLTQETVHIERVPVNRPVDQPVSVRYEGDTMIVPIFEETLVVEKRLILKEELRITKQRTELHRPQRATLRREEVSIERISAQEPPGEIKEPDAPP